MSSVAEIAANPHASEQDESIPAVAGAILPVDRAMNAEKNRSGALESSRSHPMSDMEAEGKVLEVLEKSREPLAPEQLYQRLEELRIPELQSRRAVVDLAVQHKIEVSPDGEVMLPVPKKTDNGR